MKLTLQQPEAHLWGAANILRGKTAGPQDSPHSYTAPNISTKNWLCYQHFSEPFDQGP